MTISITHPCGRSRWGIFGNVFPGKLNKLDRQAVGAYLHIHTPVGVVEIYG